MVGDESKLKDTSADFNSNSSVSVLLFQHLVIVCGLKRIARILLFSPLFCFFQLLLWCWLRKNIPTCVCNQQIRDHSFTSRVERCNPPTPLGCSTFRCRFLKKITLSPACSLSTFAIFVQAFLLSLLTGRDLQFLYLISFTWLKDKFSFMHFHLVLNAPHLLYRGLNFQN